MKKKIAILGSTGSIGKSTLEVIKKNKRDFKVVFLSANNNYKKLIKQAKMFRAQNVLIKNVNYYEKVKKALRAEKTKVFCGEIPLTKIIKSKLDYSMSAIVGLAGLQPTIDIIKISKVVAIANKETIICAWNILSKLQKKYKTELLPVDSEHYSIMELTKKENPSSVAEVIITASGGPFLKTPIYKIKNAKPKDAINHPRWKMGKKISVDSANLMNKVFEVIEAYKIFKFSKDKYKILIHPESRIHSIIRFNNGITKMILYNTDMKIPIANTMYENNFLSNRSKIDIKTLNKLNFEKVDVKKFPSIKLIKKCLNSGCSSPIIINASNEVLVSLFLAKRIAFNDIVATLSRVFKDKDFNKYAKRKPKSVKDIRIIDNWARLKTASMCVI